MSSRSRGSLGSSHGSSNGSSNGSKHSSGGRADSSQIWFRIQSVAALTREYTPGSRPSQSDPDEMTPTWTPEDDSRGPPESPVHGNTPESELAHTTASSSMEYPARRHW